MGTRARHVVLVAGLMGFLTASAARAGVSVGDSVTFSFKAVDGTQISTASLKGKIVVVDFWATWCGPCMGMVPHMVEMNEKYGSKGLQIVGISLDQNLNQMKQVIKEKGMTWPEYFDGQGWNNKLWTQYGSEGIPFTMLLSPEGKVLYAGHPAGGLDGAIEKAFKETPPQLVDPKVLADATKALEDVQSKVADGDMAGAIKQMGKVPAAAKADADFATKSDELQKKLETAADGLLADAQKLIDDKEYVPAASKLKDLSSALAGTPSATKAKQMLSSLMSKPETKAAIAAAERNEKADEALAAAEKLRDDKKNELAYARFKDVVKLFAGTPAAAKAKEQLAIYEKDPAFVRRANETAAAGKAKGMLQMADNYRKAGNAQVAMKKYQAVIDAYPGTSYADAAQKAITELASQ